MAPNGQHWRVCGVAFFEWLDNASFVVLIRDSPSVFAYPTIIAFHTFSLALLVGMSCGLALRTLGVAPGIPLAPLDRYFRFIWSGFLISVLSGVPLLSTDALNFLTNPFFYIKMGGIFAAVFTVRLLRAAVFAETASPDRVPIPREGKILAVAVLVLWMIALTAGRVTAYDRFIGWQTAGAVIVLLAAMLIVGFTGARVLRGAANRRRVPRPETSINY
jgi:hypothetical protein